MTGLSLSTLPSSTPSTELPLRLLSLVRPGASGNVSGATFGFGASGAGACTVEWRVSDLLLLAGVAEGFGLQDFEPALADYMSHYIDMVKRERGAVTNMTITSVQLTPGVVEWPAESGERYFGVEAVLTVKELV